MSQDEVESLLKAMPRSVSANEVATILNMNKYTAQHNLMQLTRQGKVHCERPRMWGQNSHHMYYIRKND